MNVGLLLDMAVAVDHDRIAITAGSRSLTTGELSTLAGRGATELVAHDRRSVVFVATYGPSFAVALFAAARAGIPIVPLNYRLPAEDLRALVANHPGSLVVADDPSVIGSADGAVVEPTAWLDRLAAAPEGPPPPEVDDPELPAVLLYTSGTTSVPKAVVLRHRHLSSYVVSTVELASADVGDSSLVSVPPYHVAGVGNLLSNLYAGRRIHVLETFAPEAWLDRVRADQVTHALVVPTMLARLVDHLDGADAAVPSLRSLAYGGARTPRPVLERALAAFAGVDFVHAYGLTETSSTIAVLGPQDHRAALAGTDVERARLASVGRVIPGVEVEVRDASGEPVPPGGTGRVWLRGEQISGEYVGLGSSLDDAGWFDTCDRGYVDDRGFLFIEGRDDDTIIRGAENVSPAEIEDVLVGHPGVADAVVVGVPDEEWGQRIAAVVVPSAAPVPLAELAGWARDRLRSSRCPDLIEVWDDLPRTDNGKVIRARVIERLVDPARRSGSGPV